MAALPARSLSEATRKKKTLKEIKDSRQARKAFVEVKREVVEKRKAMLQAERERREAKKARKDANRKKSEQTVVISNSATLKKMLKNKKQKKLLKTGLKE